MGGSKKSAKPPPKKESKYKIPTVFNCPKCGGKGTVSVQIKRGSGQGYVYCNGECSRMNLYGNDDDEGFDGMDEGIQNSARGQKRAREKPSIYECPVLRLEEAVDVFFKYYESYRAERELAIGAMVDGPVDDTMDALQIGGVRRVAGVDQSQPLSAAGRRAAARGDESEEDEGLLLERDENEAEEGYEFGEEFN